MTLTGYRVIGIKLRAKISIERLCGQIDSDGVLLFKHLMSNLAVVTFILLTVLAVPLNVVRAESGDDVVRSESGQIPLKKFAKLPVFSMPVISPDGKRLAYRLIKDGKPLLIVRAIPKNGITLDEPVRTISIGDKYFEEFEWANNDRLIVNVRTAVAGRKEGGFYYRLLSIAVDPKAGPPVDLLAKLKRRNKSSYHFAEAAHWPFMLDRLKHDDNKILAVLEYTIEESGPGGFFFVAPDFHEVDVYTGVSKRTERNGRLLDYVVVDENDQVRIGWFSKWMIDYKHNRYKLFYRENEDTPWQLLQRIEYLQHSNLKPLRFDYDDQNILLVSIREHGSDYNLVDNTKHPVYRYDLKKRQVIGEYKNTAQLKLKARLSKALPSLEFEIVSVDEQRTSYIVEGYSSRQPSIYYLVDLNSKELTRLGREFPALENESLVSRNKVEYTARDGRNLFAYLTLPKLGASKKPPLVVLPHGGPFSKDEEGFDNYAHFFASRGYAVIQPQFRGSTGNSIEYEEAGYGEWTQKIQHDITDSARWLISEKLVDSERICIVGASFGGYAAGWAALNEAELYRCGVSINGVMDLQYMIKRQKYSLVDPQGRELFNDRKDVTEQSPYRQYKNLKIPLMLIAARGDAVVPYRHSAKLYKKMKANNQDVKYIELEGGEHWQTNEEHEIKILTEVEQFLARHLD
jgi:dipeptidyl aminopeptidase/acylaminoacyl peptidase